MSERTDHVAVALRIIESDRDSEFGWETADAQHLANLAEAQAHATLALVEQQRIANLIALGQVRIGSSDLPLFRHLVAEPVGEYDARPATEMREALGLS